MQTNAYPMDSLRGRDPLQRATNWSSRATGDASIEFGNFSVLLRQRWLLADGVPIEIGTRAFDVLLVLLEADGALVTKEELLNRVWSGIFVSEENLRVQISKLRKALGADRDLIRTEFGCGYRFIGIFRSNATARACRGRTGAELRGSSRFGSARPPTIAQCGFNSRW